MIYRVKEHNDYDAFPYATMGFSREQYNVVTYALDYVREYSKNGDWETKMEEIANPSLSVSEMHEKIDKFKGKTIKTCK